MPWGPIIVALIQWLGPLLAEAFARWLEKRLQEKAAVMAPRKFGATPLDDKLAKLELLRQVRGDLWFWQFGKRRALDQCIKAVETGKRHIDASLIGTDAV